MTVSCLSGLVGALERLLGVGLYCRPSFGYSETQNK